MRRVLLSTVVLLAMLSPAVPAGAGAETSKSSFSGDSAHAHFSSVEGCIDTFTDVQAVINGNIKSENQPPIDSGIFVFIGQFDICTETELMAALAEFVPFSASDLVISEDFGSATLHTTVEVFDSVSETSFPVDIDLSWTAVSDFFQVKDHFQFREAGFKFNGHSKATLRDAVAEGTVTDGITNFTPEPSFEGDLGTVKDAFLTITKE